MYWIVFTFFMCLAVVCNILAERPKTSTEQAVEIYCMVKFSDPLNNIGMAENIYNNVVKIVQDFENSPSGPPSAYDCWYTGFNRPALKVICFLLGLTGVLTIIHSIRMSLEEKLKIKFNN